MSKVYEKIGVADYGQKMFAKPTEDDLDRAEAELGFNLPRSYREFALLFGGGELAGWFRIYAPLPKKNKNRAKDLVEEHNLVASRLPSYRLPKRRKSAFFCFGDTAGGPLLLWNKLEVTKAPGSEYRVYHGIHNDEVYPSRTPSPHSLRCAVKGKWTAAIRPSRERRTGRSSHSGGSRHPFPLPRRRAARSRVLGRRSCVGEGVTTQSPSRCGLHPAAPRWWKFVSSSVSPNPTGELSRVRTTDGFCGAPVDGVRADKTRPGRAPDFRGREPTDSHRRAGRRGLTKRRRPGSFSIKVVEGFDLEGESKAGAGTIELTLELDTMRPVRLEISGITDVKVQRDGQPVEPATEFPAGKSRIVISGKLP